MKPIISYAHIDTFHKKGDWFKIWMEFLRPLLAKIELICLQLAMPQLSGVQERIRLFHVSTRTTSSGCFMLHRTVHALWNLFGNPYRNRAETEEETIPY